MHKTVKFHYSITQLSLVLYQPVSTQIAIIPPVLGAFVGFDVAYLYDIDDSAVISVGWRT